jgi:hypothetical protein
LIDILPGRSLFGGRYSGPKDDFGCGKVGTVFPEPSVSADSLAGEICALLLRLRCRISATPRSLELVKKQRLTGLEPKDGSLRREDVAESTEIGALGKRGLGG